MSAEQFGSRCAFEAYMRKQSPCVNLGRQKPALGGRYRTTTVERAWQLWQAAYAYARVWTPDPELPRGRP